MSGMHALSCSARLVARALISQSGYIKKDAKRTPNHTQKQNGHASITSTHETESTYHTKYTHEILDTEGSHSYHNTPPARSNLEVLRPQNNSLHFSSSQQRSSLHMMCASTNHNNGKPQLEVYIPTPPSLCPPPSMPPIIFSAVIFYIPIMRDINLNIRHGIFLSTASYWYFQELHPWGAQ